MSLLRDHKAPAAPKLNQVLVDGQPHKSFGPASAPSSISGSDKITELEHPFPIIISHIHCFPLPKLRYSLPVL
jgi:hypothetical protein